MQRVLGTGVQKQEMAAVVSRNTVQWRRQEQNQPLEWGSAVSPESSMRLTPWDAQGAGGKPFPEEVMLEGNPEREIQLNQVEK